MPAASGGNGTIVYTASGLPAGLVFDATGADTNGCLGTEAREICGTPTTAASAATVTIAARDSDGNTMNTDRATLTFSVTVEANAVPTFGSGSVSARTFVAGQAIDEFTVPAASGGNGTIAYAASNLPDGLRFDATGSDSPGCPGSQARRVCGTPTTAAAAATVTITAQDGDANMAAADRGLLTFTVTVETDSAPDFGMGSVADAVFAVNTAIAEFTVPAASGGNGTIVYAASGLPTGLVFDATGADTPGCTGTEAREICGTPTAIGGPTTVTIAARDSDSNLGAGDRATLTFTITVSSDAPPSFGSGSVPAASGGNGTITYAASGLPTGLVFDATGTDTPGCTGSEAREICGTPSVAGTGTVTITAQDGDTNMAPGDRATLSFAYSVAADTAPTFGMASVTAKTFPAGAAITEFAVPAASGGNGTLSYAAANLPSGLVFDATGTDAPGCPGTEAREVCGAPDAATSGASDVASGSLPVTPTAPAVVVSRTSLSLDEDPGADDANQGAYTLVLDTRPTGCTAGVGVSVASGNPDVTPEPTTLTFTPDDWNAPQTVTVTAGQDDDGIDDRATLGHTIGTACAAAGYPATLAVPSVEVAVADDDAPPPAGDVPTEVRAEATATGLLVTWTAAAGATSYKVQWRLAGQEWSPSRQEETTATRLELDGLAPGAPTKCAWWRWPTAATARPPPPRREKWRNQSTPRRAWRRNCRTWNSTSARRGRSTSTRPSRTRTATACATRRPRTAPLSRCARPPAGCASAASARARRRFPPRRPTPRA